MAPNSPESPSKKRKQSTDQLKRDQPLFGSHRPLPTLQQPPEFLTDSLNTSYIPTPSPPKSPTRQNGRARPRQALERRSLTAAFRATATINDENQSPISSPRPERRSTEPIRKPRPSQTTDRSASKAPNQASTSPARVRTPTPPRGRHQESVDSPANSESSPGRGYAEAYQRIVEEENLAHEETLDDMDLDGYNLSQDELSQQFHHLQHFNAENTDSPMSLKASRRASPHVIPDRGKIAEAQEDKENRRHDSGSESDMSHMDNVTDTSLDSGSSQHARDMQRLNGVLKSGTKAFSKAKLGDKVGLTLENLRRRNGSNESLGSNFSAGSLSNRGSDPSMNIPRAWGRKAKPGKEWLNRINSRSGKLTGDVPKRHVSGDQMIADNAKRERGEPVDEWTAAASEVPLPSSANVSSQTASSSNSTLTSTVPTSAPVDKRRSWEVNDDEFTGRSLQISESPPIRIRNTTLDRIREREIERLERQAVTTNRLDELRENKSEERLGQRPSSRSSLGAATETQSSSQRRRSSGESSHQSRSQEPVSKPRRESSEDQGESIPDTPVVVYRTKSNNFIGFDAASAKKIQESRETARRPDNDRKDSRDLLKRLARATSESPKPAETARDHQGSVSPSAEYEEEDEAPQDSSSRAIPKTPVVTGAWVDQIMGQSPENPLPNVYLKTPFVTGAWVDTPLPTGGRGPPMPTPSGMEDEKDLSTGKPGATDLVRKLGSNAESRPKLRSQEPLKYTGPPLPQSALDEIIKEAKAGEIQPKPRANSDSEEDPTLHLGESTIQSLEELIANDTDFSTVLATTPPSQETSPPTSVPSPRVADDSESPTSSATKDLHSYTNILSRLTTLAPSLRASKKQLASLERAVADAPTARPPPRNNRASTQRDGECDEAGEFHDFIWPCQKCGCPGRIEATDFSPIISLRDNVTSIRIRVLVPRLWYWREKDWRPRLTWLGVLTAVGWALVLGEVWARDRYCHKFYATSMRGFGVDASAPRPPFVLAKVVYRGFASNALFTPLYVLLKVLSKIVGGVVGYFVGFMFGDGDGGGGLVEGVKQASGGVGGIPGSGWSGGGGARGADLGFGDDEIL